MPSANRSRTWRSEWAVVAEARKCSIASASSGRWRKGSMMRAASASARPWPLPARTTAASRASSSTSRNLRISLVKLNTSLTKRTTPVNAVIPSNMASGTPTVALRPSTPIVKSHSWRPMAPAENRTALAPNTFKSVRRGRAGGGTRTGTAAARVWVTTSSTGASGRAAGASAVARTDSGGTSNGRRPSLIAGGFQPRPGAPHRARCAASPARRSRAPAGSRGSKSIPLANPAGQGSGPGFRPGTTLSPSLVPPAGLAPG